MATVSMYRHSISLLTVMVATALATIGCGSTDDPAPATGEQAETERFDGDQARLWVDEILGRIEEDGISPPVASRILGYTGVGIYEASVDGMPDRGTLGERLHGLDAPPELDSDTGYDPVTVMHSTLGHLTPILFDGADSSDHLIEFAEHHLEQRYEEIDYTMWTDSANRGVLIAEVIGSRALSDGYYARTNGEFAPPNHPGGWEPVDGEEPLEPHWRTLEPFALDEADDCRPGAHRPFSTTPGSSFYQQAQAVHEATPEPGSEEMEIAEFWADTPGESPTPPGHWMELAGQLVGDLELNLTETAELYATLGVAVADVFISCWDEKYRSYLLRPVTYINEHIDPDWEPAVSTPPFPEYTSGHASVSGASATVLTELFGDMSFDNRVHEQRGMGVRSYESFDDAAEESGISRLYGGIHYPMANEEGLQQGQCVGDRVLEAIAPR